MKRSLLVAWGVLSIGCPTESAFPSASELVGPTCGESGDHWEPAGALQLVEPADYVGTATEEVSSEDVLTSESGERCNASADTATCEENDRKGLGGPITKASLEWWPLPRCHGKNL